MGIIQYFKNKKYLDNIRVTWLKTLVYGGCTINMEEQKKTFDLLDMEITPTGVRAISLVPYGLGVDKLLEYKNRLEDSLNAYIEINKNPFKPKIYIDIILKEPKFIFEPIKAVDNQFYLGYKVDGKPHFADLNINNNFLIAGLRGQGKTVYIIILISNCMYHNPDIDFCFVQIKKNELSIFNACLQTKVIANTIEDTYNLLECIMWEIDRRAELFKDAGKGIDNINKYNKKFKDKKLNRVFVVVEELSFFMDVHKDDKDYVLAKNCWTLLKGIAKAGRSCGIGIWGVVQKTTRDNLDSNLKSQMNRITFRQESNTDSINVIDTDEATQLRERECICTVGTKQKLIVPTVNEDYSDIIDHLPQLGQEPTKAQIKANKDTLKALHEKVLDISKHKDILVKDTQTEEVKKIDVTEVAATQAKTTIVKTDRDKAILKFIESYGAVTVQQAHTMFFNGNKSVEGCRRRLTELVEGGELKVANLDNSKQKQYYLDKPKSLHDIYIINAYCSILENGGKILEFKLVPHIMGNKVIPDAFIKYKIGNKVHSSFIEVDYSHITEQPKIALMEQYALENNIKFNILVAKKGKLSIHSNSIEILQTDFKFSTIYK